MPTLRLWRRVAAAVVTSGLIASPVGGQEGGPKVPSPGKGPPGGKVPQGYLRQLDLNRDGVLKNDELPELAQSVLEQVMQMAGASLREGAAVERVERAVADSVARQNLPADFKSRRLADELMGQFDVDRDGVMVKEEWKGLEEATGWKGGGGHRKADFDFDEQVTPLELTFWITLQDPVHRGGDPRRSLPPPPNARAKPPMPPPTVAANSAAPIPLVVSPWQGRRTYRFLPPSERLPAGLPEWFHQKDSNQDGQVMMSEYATQFTDATVAEFMKQDLNRDGVITSVECLKVLARPADDRLVAVAAAKDRSRSAGAGQPAVVAAIGRAPAAPDAAVLARRYDINRDGELDKEEWKAMEHAEGLKGGGGHKKADQNRDDRIEPAELKAWLASRPVR